MICPRCKVNRLDPILVRNSLSRKDNKIYICNDCGMNEAVFDFNLFKWNAILKGQEEAKG